MLKYEKYANMTLDKFKTLLASKKKPEDNLELEKISQLNSLDVSDVFTNNLDVHCAKILSLVTPVLSSLNIPYFTVRRHEIDQYQEGTMFGFNQQVKNLWEANNNTPKAHTFVVVKINALELILDFAAQQFVRDGNGNFININPFLVLVDDLETTDWPYLSGKLYIKFKEVKSYAKDFTVLEKLEGVNKGHYDWLKISPLDKLPD